MAVTVPLSKLLDEIWAHPESRVEIAQRHISQFSQDTILILLSLDAASTFGPPSGRITFELPNQFTVEDCWGKSFLRASVNDSNFGHFDRCILAYHEIDYCVYHEESSPIYPRNPEKHSIVSLALAMQSIRDHLDSALLMPPQYREAELSQFSLQAGLDIEAFRRLASWYSAIASKL